MGGCSWPVSGRQNGSLGAELLTSVQPASLIYVPRQGALIWTPPSPGREQVPSNRSSSVMGCHLAGRVGPAVVSGQITQHPRGVLDQRDCPVHPLQTTPRSTSRRRNRSRARWGPSCSAPTCSQPPNRPEAQPTLLANPGTEQMVEEIPCPPEFSLFSLFSLFSWFRFSSLLLSSLLSSLLFRCSSLLRLSLPLPSWLFRF